MASYYVINVVRFGTTIVKPGSLVSDALDDITGLQSVGALLWPSSDADVAAAAAKAQAYLAQGGSLDIAAGIMTAAIDSIQKDLGDTGAGKGASDIGVQDAAGKITATTVEAALAELKALIDERITVRGVVFANVANLASFTVAGNDGLTYVENDLVLLANQSTAAQCGIYKVGAVGGGTAALTRVGQYSAGAIKNGMVVQVSEGTIWAGSSWKAMCTGAKVWGTDDPVFYPKHCRGVHALTAGVLTLGSTHGLFLFSTTRSSLQVTVDTPAGTLGTWGYKAAVADKAAGKSGTGAAVIRSIDANGSAATSDTSTVDWLVTNW